MVLNLYSPCPWTWTPAEFGVWAARDVALGSVLEALHADVGIGAQACLTDYRKVCSLEVVVLQKPGCHPGKHRCLL